VNTPLLLDAALRSLIMGASIWAALRLLRIRQVRAQRLAWLLALAGALAMPLIVGGQMGPRLLPQFLPPFPVEELLPSARRVEVSAAPAPTALQASAALHLDINPHPKFTEPQAPRSPFSAAALSSAVLGLYCLVAATLLLRLCMGAGLALRLRDRAQRANFPCGMQTDVRISSRIATPVTIASTVLLPSNYASWEESTLRVVLTHEGAHVRQGDFYVQLLASLHCALFWFSPFSWWLRRHLSELGEALSDCAAVEQAQSRTSYAEILLAFATGAQWPRTSVAMARANSLTPRIERLLNDRGFEQSFGRKRRSVLIAVGVVALALLASTSMVRVQAASPAAAAAPAPAPPARVDTDIDATSSDASRQASDHRSRHNDEILVIHSGESRVAFDSGEKLPPQAGDYIYYRHAGKTYLIQDANTVAKAHALFAPMQELGRMQQELGKQQAMLGKEQQALGARQQFALKVQTPEFKRDLAELEVLVKQMDLAHLSEQIDRKALAELQSHLGELQGRVGALQADLDMRAGRMDRLLGEQQGALGEQQGKLGEEQGRLGEQQRRIVEDAKARLTPLIEQAIREGNAKPVN
jgi:beta-lactamase regulating signal transducer with metallopeptidase domain